jgi:CRISPR-associated endonuclease/helicase Cas3
MEFYSHPDKKLIVHLTEVRNLSKNEISDELDKASEIISYCHDFGKYTTYFQKYLFSRNKEKSKLSNHGFISAVFAAYIALDIFKEGDILPFIIYNAVLHHHGSIENPSLDLPIGVRELDENSDSIRFTEKVDITFKQLLNMEKNMQYIVDDYRSINCDNYKSIGYDKYVNDFITNKPVKETLLRIRKIDHKFQRRSKDSAAYFTHQILYSALIAADKISASNTKLPKIKTVDYDILNNAKEEKFKTGGSKSRINEIRSDIFYDIQSQISKNYNKTSIFSITSPTGTGKTYSGFFAALKLKQLLGDERKIIYSLPFTSIINQNYEAVYELFKNVDDFEKENSTYIIKHHNLADVEYNTSEYENCTKQQAELLIENWNSGIIITTFVQLLQTLIGNKNRMLKKFISLKGSIILLDEVQAIDIKYFRLVDYILKKAVEYLDCKIIMMTATRPLLLQDSLELLSDNKKYFSMFNRTNIVSRIEPMSVEEFIDDFKYNLEDKSYLIICNTISQSLKIYKELSFLNREVKYLSTNLLPVHRKQRIEYVRDKLKAGENIILVSTQVVEAGVDFDFDEVIRDIAPMDSIIQAAGRCNRNGKGHNPGNVIIYSMMDDNEEYFGKYVYGNTLLNITKELLKEGNIPEKEYLDLIEKYFIEVNKNVNQEASDKFKKSIEKLWFTKADGKYEKYPIQKFSLIEDNNNYMDVFFRINDDAEEVYQRLIQALQEKDMNKKSELYLEIKNKIRDYTLSIPYKFRAKFNYEDKDKNKAIVNLPEEGCREYYDDEIGFIRDDDEKDYMIF